MIRAALITTVLCWTLALWLLWPPTQDAPTSVVLPPVSAPVPAHLRVQLERTPVLRPELWTDEVMPAASYRHRRAVERAATQAFGRSPPVALLAAQLRQESGYRSDATSHAGAQGMAQFMPATAEAMAKQYPELSPARPRDPAWAMLAQALHMRDLHALYPDAATACDRWAFALSAYNGGPTRLRRERTSATDAHTWSAVSLQRHRSKSAWQENRAYVRRVLYQHEPRYARAGWRGGLSCVAS